LDTADLLPFKKGAFHLAIQSGLPILPIVSAGYNHIYDSAKRSFPGGELEIRILEPIPTTGMTADDVNDLMERTRAVMLTNLKEMDVSSSPVSSGPSLPVDELKPAPALKHEAKSTAVEEEQGAGYDSVKKRKTVKA